MENVTKPKQRELPFNVDRGEIFIMYNHLSSRVIKTQLSTLIAAYCKQANLPIKHYRSIPRPVWVDFIKINGFPENYIQKPEWLEERSLTDK